MKIKKRDVYQLLGVVALAVVAGAGMGGLQIAGHIISESQSNLEDKTVYKEVTLASPLCEGFNTQISYLAVVQKEGDKAKLVPVCDEKEHSNNHDAKGTRTAQPIPMDVVDAKTAKKRIAELNKW